MRAGELIGSTHMRPFESIHELGIYLRLLIDLRDTLDKFQPVVFDRSISELIAATAPRREAPEMSSGNRRRLKKLAKEYVRPGVHVGDLHDALSRIQQQRVLWQRFVAEGVTPEVPVGIADVQVAYQQVDAGPRRCSMARSATCTRETAARVPADRAPSPHASTRSPPNPTCSATCRSAPRSWPTCATSNSTR